MGVVPGIRQTPFAAAGGGRHGGAYLSYDPGRNILGNTFPLTIIVRPEEGVRMSTLAPHLRQAARSLGPPVVIERIRSGADWLGDQVATQRNHTLLLGLLGSLALLLTIVGIFSVTAFAVARRTQEIGVRMAFGARPSDVVGHMVRDAIVPVGLGLAAGLAVAFFATRVIASFLFETTPTDPVTFATVAVMLLAAALLAAWLPARRAARIDPVVALRAE
jgi:predicted lysophospholipase L1 biosynthesis ABC-type transport system permease subunit